MPNQISITLANPKHREAITNLLLSAGLPVQDLPPELKYFYTALDNNIVIGVIGLETYDSNGLLRSLAVRPEYRKMKIAHELVSKIEALGRSLQLTKIYLLTETARDYFSKIGFEQIAKDHAPETLKASSEFSHVCPASAILMYKKL